MATKRDGSSLSYLIAIVIVIYFISYPIFFYGYNYLATFYGYKLYVIPSFWHGMLGLLLIRTFMSFFKSWTHQSD